MRLIKAVEVAIDVAGNFERAGDKMALVRWSDIAAVDVSSLGGFVAIIGIDTEERTEAADYIAIEGYMEHLYSVVIGRNNLHLVD